MHPVLPVGLSENSGPIAMHHLTVPCAPHSFSTGKSLSQAASQQNAAALCHNSTIGHQHEWKKVSVSDIKLIQ